jgi:methionyl-tRNA formyltransferase
MRLQWKMNCSRKSLAMLAIAVFFLASPVESQVRADNDAQAEPRDEISLDSAISKEDWKLRIDQARERAEQARRAWRLAPRESARKPDPPEKIATERVLSDDTSQPGDIVATDKGLFVFRRVLGMDGEKREFVPLTSP